MSDAHIHRAPLPAVGVMVLAVRGKHYAWGQGASVQLKGKYKEDKGPACCLQACEAGIKVLS